MTAEEIIRKLSLVPLRAEGGYYREMYRSRLRFPRPSLPASYRGERDASTAIYYLLTRDTQSAMHRLLGDEVFHFYLGDPVEMLQLRPDGTAGVVMLGADIKRGMSPQIVVPGGSWQGAHLSRGGELALMGTTMAPGFDPADFEEARPGQLLNLFPQHAALISVFSSAA